MEQLKRRTKYEKYVFALFCAICMLTLCACTFGDKKSEAKKENTDKKDKTTNSDKVEEGPTTINSQADANNNDSTNTLESTESVFEANGITLIPETYYSDDSHENFFLKLFATYKSGEIIWTYKSKDCVVGSQFSNLQYLTTTDTTVYLNEDGTLTALDLLTGNVLWQNTDDCGNDLSFDVNDNDILFITSTSSWFMMIDKDGKTVKKIDTDDKITIGMVQPYHVKGQMH